MCDLEGGVGNYPLITNDHGAQKKGSHIGTLEVLLGSIPIQNSPEILVAAISRLSPTRDLSTTPVSVNIVILVKMQDNNGHDMSSYSINRFHMVPLYLRHPITKEKEKNTYTAHMYAELDLQLQRPCANANPMLHMI